MRDVELADITDDAYAQLGAGQAADGVLADPQLAGEDDCYQFPAIGGDFGIARAQLVDGPADGGAAAMLTPPAVTVPAAPAPKPAYAMTGRSWNQTTYLNLYPWKKTPREGLDSNNPPVTPVVASPPPPETGITVEPAVIESGVGTVIFHGPALIGATVYVAVTLAGLPTETIVVSVTAGMTASQIAAAIRSYINDNVDSLSAAGTGGSLIVEPSDPEDDVADIVVTITAP